MSLNFDARLRRIEEKLDQLLAGQKGYSRGNKTEEYKSWIRSLFKDRDTVPVWKVVSMCNKKGYSWQMVGKTRLQYMSDEIQTGVIAGKGWHWMKAK